MDFNWRLKTPSNSIRWPMILTVWIRLLSAMPICRIKSRKVIGSSTILLITPPGGLLYSRIPYCYYVFRGSKSGGQSFMTILPKKILPDFTRILIFLYMPKFVKNPNHRKGVHFTILKELSPFFFYISFKWSGYHGKKCIRCCTSSLISRSLYDSSGTNAGRTYFNSVVSWEFTNF